MPEKSISFRSALHSNISDLLIEAGIACVNTNRMVANLVSIMASYSEEGVQLSPKVFIAKSSERLARMTGAGGYVELGRNLPIDTSGEIILKSAAPLSTELWSICVSLDTQNNRCGFGVLCGPTDPSALSVDETLMSEYDGEFPVIEVIQIAKNKVRVRTSRGEALQFRFNDDHDQHQTSNDEHFENIAKCALSEGEQFDRTAVSFFKRTIGSAVSSSHGTMIAVISGKDDGYPAALADATLLSPPLDLLDAHENHIREGRTAASLAALVGVVDLFRSMVNCDGITVLDSRGRVRAYRAFVPSGEDMPETKGGARTRAFGRLKALIESDQILGALFRSQDGRTDSKVK